MGYLPNSKWGNCSRPGCNNTDCACVKIGKDLVCFSCNKKEKTQKQIAKSQDRNKIRMLSVGMEGKNGYVRPVDNKLVDNEAMKRLKRLNEFFAEVAKIIEQNPKCWNCGEWISPADYRNSTGHILPKEIFRSVETHELCYVVVGNRCGCHHDTHTLSKFSKMPIFKEAVRCFRIFQPLITEKHKLLDEFIKYADQIII
jgi:hypothetical protein